MKKRVTCSVCGGPVGVCDHERLKTQAEIDSMCSPTTPVIEKPPRELADYVAGLAESFVLGSTNCRLPLLACADRLRDQAERIAALEAALRPFADSTASWEVGAGDLRRARDVLAQPVGGKP